MPRNKDKRLEDVMGEVDDLLARLVQTTARMSEILKEEDSDDHAKE